MTASLGTAKGAWIRVSLLSLLMVNAAAICAETSPVNISGVETKDLKLYYYSYLSFLEPHAVRALTNSLDWQRRTFGW